MPADPNRFARDLFAPLPARYDLLAEVLSFGQNGRWRSAMVDRVLPAGGVILDVASGTAGVALQLAARGGTAGNAADGGQRRESLHSVFTLFPRLAERRAQLAGTLSGGERRMLGIGRALMASPALLLVDEPSLGLAPKLTQALFAALDELRVRGHTILLVEQNVPLTLEIADRVYLLEQGEIVLQGSAAQLAESEHVKQVYLGIL